MARIARIVVPHYPHYVTQRGNRQQTVFFSDEDYLVYKNYLCESLHKANVEIWSYCFMPNHVHLVVLPKTKDGLRCFFSEAHRRYTRYINFRERWRGYLWQGRFQSFVMDEAYLLAAVRYVELNPVKANLCLMPQDWRWSSVHAHLSGQDDELVTVKPMLDRVSDWYAYLNEKPDADVEDLLIKHGCTGRPLGDNRFINKIESLVGYSLRKKKPGPKVGCDNSV